mgnify:CR=1 FL=1
MTTDVMRQDKIAEIARTVVQHAEIGIPEAGAPKVGRDIASEPWHKGGHHEEKEEQTFVGCCRTLQPW